MNQKQFLQRSNIYASSIARTIKNSDKFPYIVQERTIHGYICGRVSLSKGTANFIEIAIFDFYQEMMNKRRELFAVDNL